MATLKGFNSQGALRLSPRSPPPQEREDPTEVGGRYGGTHARPGLPQIQTVWGLSLPRLYRDQSFRPAGKTGFTAATLGPAPLCPPTCLRTPPPRISPASSPVQPELSFRASPAFSTSLGPIPRLLRESVPPPSRSTPPLLRSRQSALVFLQALPPAPAPLPAPPLSSPSQLHPHNGSANNPRP